MKAAIAGFRAEGKINYEYWSKLGADITIVDEKSDVENLPEGVPTILGDDALEKLQDFDLVVRTASLNPNKIKTNGKIWSATNEFFAKCPAPIIGVTGTKGKGTTATLIAEILEEAGYKTWLVGNIGKPALGVLDEINEYYSVISNEVEKSDQTPRQARGDKEGIVVFELSSFQLWDLKKSPETAVVLMIETDHMDIHSSMEEYVAAKANIAVHQGADDLLVYHPTNQYSAAVASRSIAQKKRYLSDEGAHITGDEIVINEKAICKTSEVGLLGEHNLENICAAVTAAWRYTQDAAAVKTAITSFKGLPHRLEFVRELDGIKYYNDSFSSAPGASLAAVHAFSQPVILIAGGYNKGVDYSEFAKVVHEARNVKKILLIGEVKDVIADLLRSEGCKNYEVLATKDFKEVIEIAQAVAQSGDVVLLSPGTSSFDMFKNFYDRGEQFKKIVNEL